MLVVNARASGVRPPLVAAVQSELRRCGASVTRLVTESPLEWVEAVGDDVDRRVILVGGDGTLHAAVNATSVLPELALIPAGRANNIARSVGIPLAPGDAARFAVEGNARPIDLAEAVTATHRRVTVEAVSVGFLAEARSHYRCENSGHVASALAAGVGALTEFRPLDVRITTPTAVHELTLAQLFVANLPLYGFGLHVAPDADSTDGLLDVVAISGRGRMGIPGMIARLLRTEGLEPGKAHRWRLERVRIEPGASAPIIADSFDLAPGPVDVHVLPKALALVRP